MPDEKDDIIIEDDPDLTGQLSKEKKLREKLKNAESKAKEYLDGWQRAQADFANLRKQDEKSRQEFAKFAQADLVSQLIPVLDSFNLALDHGSKEVEPVYKQMLSVLKSNGLEELDPVGEAFDPRIHESVGEVAVEDKEEDQKIVEVLQKGYILSGKTVRPAKVKIGEYKDN